MSDEEGGEIDGEEELAAPDWRVKAGPRSKPTKREREEHEGLVRTLHDGKGSHPSPRCQAEE